MNSISKKEPVPHKPRCVNLSKDVLYSFPDEDKKLYFRLMDLARTQDSPGSFFDLESTYKEARKKGWEQYCCVAQIGVIFGFMKY